MDSQNGDLGRKVLRIVYTNYRGETSLREVVPNRIWFGATDWHPEEQWLLDAFDLEKNAERSFALSAIRTCFP
jgi:predicted DNA-binding transcriptional regulator YafY